MRPGHDVPGRILHQMGGVALNVALALARLDRRVELLSAVGRDTAGDGLLAKAVEAGIGCAHVTRTDGATDSYMAIEDGSGDVFAAVADCVGLERWGETVLAPLRDGRLGSAARPWSGTIVLDGNFAKGLLDGLASDPAMAESRLALVPASPGKAARLATAMTHPQATLYLNRIEAEILSKTSLPSAPDAAMALVELGAAHVLVTDSHRTAAAARPGQLVIGTPPKVVSRTTTGAGDALLAAHLDATTRGADAQTALDAALAAAARHISRGVPHDR